MEPDATDPASLSSRSDPLAQRVFRLDGEYWTITYEGQTFHLRDSKGLHYLAVLLYHPRQQYSALHLVESAHDGGSEAGSESPEARHAERARSAVTKRIKASVAKIRSHHPSLGYHLEGAVRTGGMCVYHPDPCDPVAWAG